MVRKLLAACAVSALALSAAPAAAAINLGFESGLAGWTLTGFGGSAGNLTNAQSVTFDPFEGASFGYVQASDGGVYATLSQAITLAAGDVLKGKVGFLANDYLPFDDDGYLRVNGSPIFASNVTAVGPYGSTGWQSFSFTALTAGTYTLELGVRNSIDSLNSSWAVLDNVSVSGAVPEPATWAMMILGMGITGCAMRRRRTLAAA